MGSAENGTSIKGIATGQVVKLGVIAILAVLAGGVAQCANRNVYSKPEVDQKVEAVEALSVERDSAINARIEQQYEYNKDQLQLIRGDQREIKEMIREIDK